MRRSCRHLNPVFCTYDDILLSIHFYAISVVFPAPVSVPIYEGVLLKSYIRADDTAAGEVSSVCIYAPLFCLSVLSVYMMSVMRNQRGNEINPLTFLFFVVVLFSFIFQIKTSIAAECESVRYHLPARKLRCRFKWYIQAIVHKSHSRCMKRSLRLCFNSPPSSRSLLAVSK